MNKVILNRSVFLFLIITLLLVFLIGVFHLIEILYPSYFSQTEYTQIAFIGNQSIPTAKEILFSEFKNFKTIIISSAISLMIIYLIRFKKSDKTLNI